MYVWFMYFVRNVMSGVFLNLCRVFILNSKLLGNYRLGNSSFNEWLLVIVDEWVTYYNPTS